MAKSTRLDDLLVERGMFSCRDDVLRAVVANEVLVDDVPAASAAQKVPLDAAVRLRRRRRYVSRGGDKLKGAIDGFGLAVADLRCLDVGSSTGGFTDCLLREGARSVACVDVNYGQLAWEVRTDARVSVFERTNIKTADPQELGAPFDLIVIDVSFIGLASLASTLAAFSQAGTQLVALVKPQFESRRGETDHGVVRDEEVRLRTIEEVKRALAENGFATEGEMTSPIKGPSGNIEYLLHAVFSERRAYDGILQ